MCSFRQLQQPRRGNIRIPSGEMMGSGAWMATFVLRTGEQASPGFQSFLTSAFHHSRLLLLQSRLCPWAGVATQMSAPRVHVGGSPSWSKPLLQGT